VLISALLARMRPQWQHQVLWAWNTAIEKTGGDLYSRALLAQINGGLMFLTLNRCSLSWPNTGSTVSRRLA
jgi:hypothetical protein